MVLFGTVKLTGVFGGVRGICRGPNISGFKIEEVNNLTLGKLFFKLCKACQLRSMASIPPSAFSAGHIRETQRNARDMKLSKTSKGNESAKYFNTTNLELSPLKYNSKLMNSIWGIYNRYSPHNVKKVNDAFVFHGELQQSATNSPKTEPVITLSSSKLDNVWATMNVSQTQ